MGKFKFDHLILRKILKTVATRCHILRLKCIKFDFGWGFAPDPAGGAQNAPPDLLAGFKGVLLLTEGYGGGNGKGKGKEGRKREGTVIYRRYRYYLCIRGIETKTECVYSQ